MAFAAHVRDTLMCVPVFLLRQGFVDAIVEVFVMGENDMTANVVKLKVQSVFGVEYM